MKRKLHLFLFLCLLFTLNSSYSQVQVENLSFGNALQKVKESNKLLMVVMDDVLFPANNDFTTKALTSQAEQSLIPGVDVRVQFLIMTPFIPVRLDQVVRVEYEL